MYKPIKFTSITLIPNVPNASAAKLFRPISYCTMLYKLISKVLTRRIQQVIPRVVKGAQSGFIPKRQILDNILLASELLKGCGWKSIWSRCMIKIDPKKTYDSV